MIDPPVQDGFEMIAPRRFSYNLRLGLVGRAPRETAIPRSVNHLTRSATIDPIRRKL
jgi:hypothetical protein